MQGSEFFPWLALTGIVLGPYLIYEAKGHFAAVMGWGITVSSAVALCYYTWTFWPSGWPPLAWSPRYLIGLVVLVVLGGIAAFAIRSRRQTKKWRPDALAMSSAAIEVRLIPAEGSPAVPYVQFQTSNKTNREVDAGGRPNKLRFVAPTEQTVIGRDIPATVRIGKGKLIVKAFTDKGFLIDERNTQDDTVRVETYSDRPDGPQVQRAWPSLTRQQISDLRNRLAATPAIIENRDNRKIVIVREEFPDCANLADDLAEAFKAAGWDITGPYKIWGKIANGIWVGGPQNDPRAAALLSNLSVALGRDYEPIAIETIPIRPEFDLIENATITRVAIGRRPRRD